MNNHAQCKRCNGFEGGMREVYKVKMDEKYGKGTWDKMEIASKKAYKFSRFEVIELEKYYRQKVNELKNEKGWNIQ
jgi:hypothetical protein